MKEETNITAQTKQHEDKSNSGGVVSYVPFYDDGQIKIYNGNFESVLPQLTEKIDVIITDPPYPDVLVEEFGYYEGILNFLAEFDCKQLIFWSAKETFPLDYTARHIWNKQVKCRSQYEIIYERNGGNACRVYNAHPIDNVVSAQMLMDIYTEHPTQKPIKLLNEILNDHTKKGELILDTFSGSGTLLASAKKLGRQAIGIEKELRWCEVAAKRLDQFELFR